MPNFTGQQMPIRENLKIFGVGSSNGQTGLCHKLDNGIMTMIDTKTDGTIVIKHTIDQVTWQETIISPIKVNVAIQYITAITVRSLLITLVLLADGNTYTVVYDTRTKKVVSVKLLYTATQCLEGSMYYDSDYDKIHVVLRAKIPAYASSNNLIYLETTINKKSDLYNHEITRIRVVTKDTTYPQFFTEPTIITFNGKPYIFYIGQGVYTHGNAINTGSSVGVITEMFNHTELVYFRVPETNQTYLNWGNSPSIHPDYLTFNLENNSNTEMFKNLSVLKVRDKDTGREILYTSYYSKYVKQIKWQYTQDAMMRRQYINVPLTVSVDYTTNARKLVSRMTGSEDGTAILTYFGDDYCIVLKHNVSTKTPTSTISSNHVNLPTSPTFSDNYDDVVILSKPVIETTNILYPSIRYYKELNNFKGAMYGKWDDVQLDRTVPDQIKHKARLAINSYLKTEIKAGDKTVYETSEVEGTYNIKKEDLHGDSLDVILHTTSGKAYEVGAYPISMTKMFTSKKILKNDSMYKKELILETKKVTMPTNSRLYVTENNWYVIGYTDTDSRAILLISKDEGTTWTRIFTKMNFAIFGFTYFDMNNTLYILATGQAEKGLRYYMVDMNQPLPVTELTTTLEAQNNNESLVFSNPHALKVGQHVHLVGSNAISGSFQNGSNLHYCLLDFFSDKQIGMFDRKKGIAVDSGTSATEDINSVFPKLLLLQSGKTGMLYSGIGFIASNQSNANHASTLTLYRNDTKASIRSGQTEVSFVPIEASYQGSLKYRQADYSIDEYNGKRRIVVCYGYKEYDVRVSLYRNIPYTFRLNIAVSVDDGLTWQIEKAPIPNLTREATEVTYPVVYANGDNIDVYYLLGKSLCFITYNAKTGWSRPNNLGISAVAMVKTEYSNGDNPNTRGDKLAILEPSTTRNFDERTVSLVNTAIPKFIAMSGIQLPSDANVQSKETLEFLRDKVNEFRAINGELPYVWTDPVIVRGVTPIKAQHWNELEQAIAETYQNNSISIVNPATKKLIEGRSSKGDVINDLPEKVNGIINGLLNK